MPKKERESDFGLLVDEIVAVHINLGLVMQGMISAIKSGDGDGVITCISEMAKWYQTLGSLVSELRNQSELASSVTLAKEMRMDKEMALRLCQRYHILTKKPAMENPVSLPLISFPSDN